MTAETKVIYHIDDEQTPYLIKIPLCHDEVTLGHFKGLLNRPNYKYFFKSVDDDFGVVKEEISDDNAKLPTFNGCIESWLVTAEGSAHSDPSAAGERCNRSPSHGQSSRLGPEGGYHGSRVASREIMGASGCSSETESTLSCLPKFPRYGSKLDRRCFRPQFHERVRTSKSYRRQCKDEQGVGLTSDLDTTSFLDSEDDQASRISSSTDITSVSRQHLKRRKRRGRHSQSVLSRMFKASSVTSITESSMSLNIITVTLNMDTVNFLGISIVGHSNQLGGDGGIYVGSIMKGGAVALDGRIEPGDMILQVNDLSFENMSNDDAVRILREAVQKPGPIRLVVAKCWDPNPKGYFTIPRTEPVRPIDPGAWVAHTNALRAELPLEYHHQQPPPPLTALTNAPSNTNVSFSSVTPEVTTTTAVCSDRFFEDICLDISVHDMPFIVRAMARPDSGLEVRDRTWLKITIANAFLGSDVVEWLHSRVHGFADRREARKYAARLLKEGYIKHTVNKITFAEQCYYIFGDVCADFARLRLEQGCGVDVPVVSHGHEDLAMQQQQMVAVPPPSSLWPPSMAGGGGGHQFYSHQSFGQSPSVASGYAAMPFQLYEEGAEYPSLSLGMT